MTPTSEEVARLMNRCQTGCGGRNALDQAHDILAECYGTLGALSHEADLMRDVINTANQALLEVNHAQQAGPGWYTRGESGLRQQVAMWVNKGLVATGAIMRKSADLEGK